MRSIRKNGWQGWYRYKKKRGGVSGKRNYKILFKSNLEEKKMGMQK